ncbi:TPA: peptidylprolyl isomerase [Legionella pneumophila]|uniref:SurA N-terminal domain-containing protein n=1 Tax=Legionella TaxID=445 RepID=UPI0007781FE7|nr:MULTISPECIES: SurA N-terminal domain-containing protein [Legionella]HAT8859677.1 peptidylprolyl isomerase [Legionella pneumophila subsp. pneumophila]MCW8394679.1 SurA N-terminal domain-containing protein [Legionella sp. PATHC039]HAT7071958.1 peptidylprolyl isomerase [Legionella pneumophila]HAT8640378.1 peptidylprolyl isomerase [Legionella pneumophila]HAT8867058.1 peptidylprolyl isomerase [Legionella pneumophila subsp. pneumophila]
MLQKLNEHIQGVVAWLVIILIAITFTLFGVDYYFQSRQISDAKVIVNDKPITMQAFETNYRRTRAQQDLPQMTAADEKNLQNQVLNQMITNEVSIQAARKYGFEVSPDQANAAIVQIPQFQEDGHFSAQRYQQALSGALFTPETFQNEVRQGMLLNQQRFAFMGTSFALSDEIKRFVRLYMQTRDYDYLTVPSDRFEQQAKISEDDIKSYYNQHHKKFMTSEQVTLDYVLLSMHDIKSQIKISPDEIKSYYEENKSNYLTPAQWRVAHILFAVPENATKEEQDSIKQKADEVYSDLKKHPQQFDKYVASKSDDKLSIANKGILPWITGGQNEYDRVLSNLTKPGQISMPVQTKYGYEIFKLIAYKPVTTKSLQEVENIIKDQLTTDMAQAKYAQVLEQLTDLSYQTPDSLDPVLDSLQLKIQHTEPFSRDGGKQAITKNKQVIHAAFSTDVLELGNNSEPIQIDNDSVIVLRVKKHIPSREQTLDEVRDQIKKILAKQYGDAKAKKIGSSLLNPVEDKQQQELIANNQFEWHSVENASRDSDKANSLINDLAFNLLRPESRDGVILDNGDYVVVKLKRINDGKLSSLDQEQRDSLIQQIEASYGMMDYDLYVNNLFHHAKIERK